MFDESVINATLADTFCNATATWITAQGTTDILVTFDKEPAYDVDGAYRTAGEVVMASCELSTVAGMQRSELLVINGMTYSVMAILDDGNGWASILLEKE